MSEEGQRELDRAFDGLEREAPERLARAIRWFRAPESRNTAFQPECSSSLLAFSGFSLSLASSSFRSVFCSSRKTSRS